MFFQAHFPLLGRGLWFVLRLFAPDPDDEVGFLDNCLLSSVFCDFTFLNSADRVMIFLSCLLGIM
jgi:hypothetical protein